MKGLYAMLVFSILVFSLVQEDDLSSQPLVEAQLDLIQTKNQITALLDPDQQITRVPPGAIFDLSTFSVVYLLVRRI